MIVSLLSISLIGAYLIGSIPFAYVYSKVIKKIDIRHYGSGNIGATNTLRVLGPRAGFIVLTLDILKGFIPVRLVMLFLATSQITGTLDWLPVLIGIFSILGHSFTIFLSFKGGKGVATSAGVFIALCPVAFMGAIFIFCLIVAISKYVSLGSILASITILIANIINNGINMYIKGFTIVVVGFIIYTHKENIKRLINKTENKISFQKRR